MIYNEHMPQTYEISGEWHMEENDGHTTLARPGVPGATCTGCVRHVLRRCHCRLCGSKSGKGFDRELELALV